MYKPCLLDRPLTAAAIVTQTKVLVCVSETYASVARREIEGELDRKAIVEIRAWTHHLWLVRSIACTCSQA